MASSEVGTTVVVVTWRGVGHVTACLDALAAQDRPHRTLVIDNASDDGTAALLASHPSAPEVVRTRRNTGYAGAMATALSVVDTPYTAWLNDDAEPAPGWLGALEDSLEKAPTAAAAGSWMELPDGSPQSLGVRLSGDGHGVDVIEERAEVFGFCGGAVLLRTDVLRAAGGVPADFFCYYEDTDTAWRLRLAGWDVVSAPDAHVVHRHGVSTAPGSPLFHRWNERNRLLMLLRCAPGRIAARELVKFAVLTLVLPLRGKPAAANFRFGLRSQVLAELLVRLPGTLRARRRIERIALISRETVWDAWAGV
ncbi:glycosyltransferase family 2 protein [Amycolatopsis sp.]|uniref:glycosyltransferase family 2 protein n=1 Tax=Amycolatopsis sp. TaxID=37632 RepID=UPI0026186724|nr:glycosyltransferase family 2 protein [Amycolatopsis sp.]